MPVPHLDTVYTIARTDRTAIMADSEVLATATEAAPDPTVWLLRFSPSTTSAQTVGAPWGQDTAYAKRAAAGVDPWDTGCQVSTFIGGYAAMSAIRDGLETCLAAAAPLALTVTDRGLVYIAGWRLNPLRDLSVANKWVANPWMDAGTHRPYPAADNRDQTVLGLLLKLIDAGVQVRVMVWMPTYLQHMALKGHAEDHLYLAAAVRAANQAARVKFGTPNQDYGVVCLDSRVADAGSQSIGATHHQKMCVIRLAGDADAMAFVGGVDLAYTRRDTPLLPSAQSPGATATGYFDGDWQSGDGAPGDASRAPLGMPALTDGWPIGDGTTPGNWSNISPLKRPNVRFPSDLNIASYGGAFHRWHDQHLQVRGPAVASVQQQFCERWVDAGFVDVLADNMGASGHTGQCGQATFSSELAAHRDVGSIDANTVTPLPAVAPTAVTASQTAPATSTVQMWRTIPARPRGKATLFAHGEFTVMAGYAHAISQAQNLIFLCDQYFWSLPTARLLNKQLKARDTLAVAVVLPPHADSSNSLLVKSASAIHRARKDSLTALCAGLTKAQKNRVCVFNAWFTAVNVGVYVHAKAHVYDGTLLVCGSANVNRRSLTGDSELALAVLDPQVASQHLRGLWSLFTGGASWPTVGTRGYDPASDPGSTFLSALIDSTTATTARTPNLITDPQFINLNGNAFSLPNKAPRDNKTGIMPYGHYYRDLMENCSLKPESIEGDTAADDLAAVSARVETPANFKLIGRSPVTPPPPKLPAPIPGP